MSQTKRPLFEGVVLNTATKFVGVPAHRGVVGVHIGWLDATSAATITLERTSYPHEEAPTETAGAADQWKDSGEVIAGPTGAAIGCAQLDIENSRQLRHRLRIVATANCSFKIYDNGGEV